MTRANAPAKLRIGASASVIFPTLQLARFETSSTATFDTERIRTSADRIDSHSRPNVRGKFALLLAAIITRGTQDVNDPEARSTVSRGNARGLHVLGSVSALIGTADRAAQNAARSATRSRRATACAQNTLSATPPPKTLPATPSNRVCDGVKEPG